MGAGTPFLNLDSTTYHGSAHMRANPLLPCSVLLAGLLAITACSDSSGLPPGGLLTPTSAALEINGSVSTDNTILLAGATAPAEIKFYRSDGTEITGIEADGFAKITFIPSSIATVADVPDEHFHKTITTGSQLGTGSMIIGYGRNAAADELSFGPYDVTVVVTGALK